MKYVAHLCLLHQYGSSTSLIYEREYPRGYLGSLKKGQPFVVFFPTEERRRPLYYYSFLIVSADGVVGTITCTEEDIDIIQRGDAGEQCCVE